MAELDKKYEDYRSKWKNRLGLKDRYIAEGYMRGQDPNWVSSPPEALERVPGNIDLHIIYGRANLSISFPPDIIEEMLAEWRLQIADQSRDAKTFTKKVIREKIALNEHRGDVSELLACGAMWFVLNDADEQTLSVFKNGNVEIVYEIIDDDERRQTRTRVEYSEIPA